MDFTTLIAAVDFETAATAVLAIAAAMVVVDLAKTGAKKVMGMLRGG